MRAGRRCVVGGSEQEGLHVRAPHPHGQARVHAHIPPQHTPPSQLQVLDGKAYTALLDAGRGGDAAAAAACALPKNNPGGPLLVQGKGGGGGGGVCLTLGPGARSALADVSVTGSSESLLSGQKPPFRLLARALDARTGAAVAGVAFAVSDPFVAATPRVRTAVKAEIPHVDDHVSKLNAVGPQARGDRGWGGW